MATLVLSGAGSAIAGPLGGAVGSLFGRSLDRSFTGTSQGKLGDLRVQSSQYGTEIPALHGCLRVAGTVIWATDLVESTAVAKSGARRSYSVSFAVALSCRALSKVGRLWADGRLIRGEAGDHKIPFDVRHHHGGEDQEPDPLVAASEGIDQTPAYRGLSLLVFEDFDLSTFGNRVPHITAEIEADADVLQPAGLLSKVADVMAAGSLSSGEIIGFAHQGDSKDVGISQVADLFKVPFSYRQQGWQIGSEAVRLHVAVGEVDISLADLTREFRRTGERSDRQPTTVSLRYFDPALDFACGEKTARIPGPAVLHRIEFSGAVASDQAKALAQAQLSSAITDQNLLVMRLPISCATIALGDVISPSLDDEESFVVVEKRIEAGEVQLLLSAVTTESQLRPSDAGGRRQEVDLEAASLTMHLIELPVASAGQTITVAVAVAGGSNPWRPVQVEVECGGTYEEATSARREGAVGVAQYGLDLSPPELIDDAHVLTVAFLHDPVLTDVSDEELLAGANLAMIGDEVVQFGRAAPKGDGVYELRRLLRGRLGTTASRHPNGAPVTLLSADRLVTFDLPVDGIGAPVVARAFGIDGSAPNATISCRGRGALPWSPAHLTVRADPNGLHLSWVRRSKSGTAWLDFVDAPGDPATEQYLVVLTGAEGSQRREPTGWTCRFSADELTVLGAKPWQVEVRQVGDFGLSEPATSTIN